MHTVSKKRERTCESEEESEESEEDVVESRPEADRLRSYVKLLRRTLTAAGLQVPEAPVDITTVVLHLKKEDKI